MELGQAGQLYEQSTLPTEFELIGGKYDTCLRGITYMGHHWQGFIIKLIINNLKFDIVKFQSTRRLGFLYGLDMTLMASMGLINL